MNSFVDETEEITIPDKWRTDQQRNAIDIAKDDSAAIDTLFAPSAAEKYAQTNSSAVTADNLYDILAERAKTSAEKLAEYDFSYMYVKSTA